MTILIPFFKRHILKNKVISYFFITVVTLQLLLDVLGKLIDFVNKL